MNNIFPLEEVQRQFKQPLTVRHDGLDSYSEILKAHRLSISGTALNVWNRIVQTYKLDVVPTAIAPFLGGGIDVPGLVNCIEEIIGQPIFRDISCTECEVPDSNLERNRVSLLIVAHVFPNDLNLSDIFLQNPYKPIPESKRKYEHQHCKGLGQLKTIMSRIDEQATMIGADNITLTAAADDLVPLFAKYGFKVESNMMGAMARAMEKKVARK